MIPPSVETIKHGLNVAVTEIEHRHTQEGHGGARPDFGYLTCRCGAFVLKCLGCDVVLFDVPTCEHESAA